MNEQTLKELFYNDVFQEVEPEVGEDGRYHGIYVIQNQINYKFYVGKHSSDDLSKDKYFGSGVALKSAIRKYGKENFKMKYFHFSESAEQVHLDEDEVIGIVLDEIFEGDWQSLNKVSYNLRRNQGFNGFSEETRRKISENHFDTAGEKNPMYGRTGELSPMYGTKGELSPSFGLTGTKSGRFSGFSVGFNDNLIIICDGYNEMVKNKLQHSHISRCISGNLKQHKGYKWLRTMDKQAITDLLESREFVNERSLEIYNQM